MSGNDNEQPASTGPLSLFWLNSLQSLLNAFLDLDPSSQTRIASLDGLVVRVKTFAPYQVFYLQFTNERIEVTPIAQGEVRARLSGRLRDLVWTFLGLESEERAEAKGSLNLWGDNETTDHLRNLLQEFNLRAAAGHWLRARWPVNQLWQKLGQQDFSWLHDLQPIPELIRQTQAEVAALRTRIEAQDLKLIEMQVMLRKQLQLTRLLLGLAVVTLVGAGVMTLAQHLSWH